MDHHYGISSKNQKYDFIFNTLILGSTVVFGVVGYIYYSMKVRPSKQLEQHKIN